MRRPPGAIVKGAGLIDRPSPFRQLLPMPHAPSAPPLRLPEIIAHRGASREHRENTLAAFARALEDGADGIELDVHGTSDGVLVVHHDPVVRVGHGEASEDVPIGALTAADVAALRWDCGEGVPTLADVFRLVDGRARVYVEVKAPGLEGLVTGVLERYPSVTAAVHAFDHRVPVGVRARRPGTSIGLLSASYPLNVCGVLASWGAEAFWQHATLIDEPLVRAVHDAGVRVIAWTVNSTPHARQLAAWGVDALCTDVPGELRAALTAPGHRRSGA